MKKLFGIVLACSVPLVMVSCYYDEVLDIDVPLPDNVSFQEDIQPIFNANCLGCHSGDREPDLREENSYTSLLDGYVIPEDASASILYKSLLNIDGVPLMPPAGQLSDYDISVIEKWINDGALDN